VLLISCRCSMFGPAAWLKPLRLGFVFFGFSTSRFLASLFPIPKRLLRFASRCQAISNWNYATTRGDSLGNFPGLALDLMIAICPEDA